MRIKPPIPTARVGTVTRDEREALDHFTSLYAGDPEPVAVTIERAVIGADWGANGYLTRSQADELATLLRLGSGSTLLDVGAGRGWPGLYLARASGCSVVLTDLPVEGLRLALDRAVQEGMAERVLAVAASAVRLPLRPASVDAVVQSDVLC